MGGLIIIGYVVLGVIIVSSTVLFWGLIYLTSCIIDP